MEVIVRFTLNVLDYLSSIKWIPKIDIVSTKKLYLFGLKDDINLYFKVL